jgi:prepilin-type N-terminal cleavage/methylation domain-containing protein
VLRRGASRRTPDGYTLVEVVVAVALVAVVAGAIARSRAQSQGAATDALARTESRRQLRAGAGAVLATLRGIAPAADLHALADTVLELRVTLGASVTCAVAPGGADTGPSLTVLVPRAGGIAAWHDAPAAGDELLVLVDSTGPADSVAASGDSSGTGAPEALIDSTRWRWVALRVGGAGAPARAPCAGGADEAVLRVPVAIAAPAEVRVGGLVLLTRRGRWSVYASRGRWFLGWRDVAASGTGLDVVQPVSGPHDHRDARGAWRAAFAFSFADAAGLATGSPARVAAIAVRLAAGDRAESLAVVAAPRNVVNLVVTPTPPAPTP